MFEFGQSSGATIQTTPDTPKCGLMPAKFKESLSEMAGAVKKVPEKVNVKSMIDKITIGAYNKLNTLTAESDQDTSSMTEEEIDAMVADGSITAEEAEEMKASLYCSNAAADATNDKTATPPLQKAKESVKNAIDGCKKVVDDVKKDADFIKEQLAAVNQGLTDAYRENICSTMAFPQCVGCPHCTANSDPFGIGALMAELKTLMNSLKLGDFSLADSLLNCPGLQNALVLIAEGGDWKNMGLDMLKRAGLNALMGNIINSVAGQGITNLFKEIISIFPKELLAQALATVDRLMHFADEHNFRSDMGEIVEWSGRGMDSYICGGSAVSSGLVAEKVQDEDGNDVENESTDSSEIDSGSTEVTPEIRLVPEGSKPLSENVSPVIPGESLIGSEDAPVVLSASEKEGLAVLQKLEESTKKDNALCGSGDAAVDGMIAQIDAIPSASIMSGKTVSGVDCTIIGNFQDIPASVIASMPGCNTPLATLKAAYGTYCLRTGKTPPRDVSYERFVSLDEPLWAS